MNPRHNKRAGAAAVELAIVLPFLVMMFSLAVDFGRTFNAAQVLDQAATTGATYASGAAWVPTAQTTMNDAAVAAACLEGASLNPPVSADNIAIATTGTTVTVTITYNYPLATAVLLPTGTVQLQRSVTMPVAPAPGS